MKTGQGDFSSPGSSGGKALTSVENRPEGRVVTRRPLNGPLPKPILEVMEVTGRTVTVKEER